MRKLKKKKKKKEWERALEEYVGESEREKVFDFFKLNEEKQPSPAPLSSQSLSDNVAM